MVVLVSLVLVLHTLLKILVLGYVNLGHVKTGVYSDMTELDTHLVLIHKQLECVKVWTVKQHIMVMILMGVHHLIQHLHGSHQITTTGVLEVHMLVCQHVLLTV